MDSYQLRNALTRILNKGRNMSEDIYGKITEDSDIFKKILSKVPGFSGYIEREKRRDSDKLLREIVANNMEEQWSRISALQRDFISQGEIAYVDDIEAAAIKVRTLADRIKRATYGYAGLFDAVKINEDELAQLYSFDASLLDSVDDISRAVDNVEISIGTDGLPASIRHLSSVARDMTETYNKRQEVFYKTSDEISEVSPDDE
jgi:hypothetical protein